MMPDGYVREIAAQEMAEAKLLNVLAGMLPVRMETVIDERNRRKELFDRLTRETPVHYLGTPERRAAESVYADVIAGRL